MPRVTQARRQPRTHAPRTLWEEGRHPGALVVLVAAVALVVATLVSLWFGERIGVFFDVVFVLTCIGAALAVRPRDFFTVGVLPPLLLAATVLALALADRGAVARADDPLAQALVSGLAHHALALVLGYGLALAVLALRQVALRNRGQLRRRSTPARSARPQAAPGRVPQPRTGEPAAQPAAESPASAEQDAPAAR
ncbi:DUF6542 domain-containing protein [Nocardioides caldifontis]|uniref:DUF6542 domain-containing protein n=1 Tax=Nocardioides caldifontis TaxID=2588938 RepID=UPI003B849944